MAQSSAIIGLDIGSVRTGIAIARPPVYIASPVETVLADDLVRTMQTLVRSEQVTHIVAGLPRNMSGEATSQTAFVQEQVAILQQAVSLPIAVIDEAATSIKAEAELKQRKKPYVKEDIDMLAAVYILEDYMREYPEIAGV